MSTFLTAITHQPSIKNNNETSNTKTQIQPEQNSVKNNETKPTIDLALKPMNEQVKIVEEKYLSYAIEQNTKYTDLEKVRLKLLSLAIERYNIYNSNKIKISQLKKQYSEIIDQSHVEVILHYIPGLEALHHYNKEIEKLKTLIRKKAYDKDVYKHMYDKLYHKNYLIKKRVDNELKYESILNKQYSDYKIIQSHALMALSGQNQKLDLMKEYYEKSVSNNKQILLKKAKYINNLDYQIEIIKTKTKEADDVLKDLNQKQFSIKNELVNQLNQFKLIKRDFGNQRKRFYSDWIKLRTMQSFVNVKTFEDLINCFNKQNSYLESLRLQFHVNNKIILKKQEELSKYEQEMKEITLKIKEKQKSMQLKQQEMKTQMEITTLKSKIENATLESNGVSNQIKEKINILQKIFDFCRKGIMKIIQELKNSKSIYYYSNNLDNSSLNIMGYSQLLSLLLNKRKEISLSFNDFDINIKNSLITLCYLISIYSNLFTLCYYDIIDNIHKANVKTEEIVNYEKQQCLLQQQKQLPHNTSSKNNNSSFTHNTNPFPIKEDHVHIKQLYDTQISDQYHSNLNETLYQLESKNKSMKLKEQELLSNLNFNDDELSNDEKHFDKSKIKKNDLYQNFMVYLKQEGVNVDPVKTTKQINNIESYRKKKKRMRQSFCIDASKGRGNSFRQVNGNNLDHSMSRSSTCFSTVHNKSFVHSHPKKVLDIIKKYHNELAQENNKNLNKPPIHQNKQTPFYITPSLSQKLLNRANSQRYIRNSISSFDKYSNRQTYCYSNEEPDFSDDDDKHQGDPYYDENDDLGFKKSEYRFYKEDPEFAAIFKRINDLRNLDLEYNKKESFNNNENPQQIFSNFERKYLKKDKLFLKRLKQLESHKDSISHKESSHKKDSNLVSSSKNESQLDNSYNVISNRKSTQLYNISQASNKSQILNRSLSKILNISSSYLPN